MSEATDYNKIDFELNPSQFDTLDSEARETFFISGLGGGKSFTLGAAIQMFSLVPGSLGFLGAPSKDIIKESTWPQVQEAMSKLGIEEGLHYIVNERPPESWGVKIFSKLGSNRVITFAWGSYLIVDGLENFNKRRGSEYDYILVDEFRDIKEGAREVLVARARGKTFKKLGKKTRVIYATTPPENPLYLMELSEKQGPDLRFIMSSSMENKHNLPEDYIEGLLDVYDDETAEREIYGKLTIAVKDRFAYKFSESQHTKAVKYLPGDDLFLSFDFNVDPMTCVAFQTDHQNFLHALKEFRIPDGDTPAMCDAIKGWIQQQDDDPYLWITGDASGNNRQAATRGALTHYQIIKQELGLQNDQFKVPRSNASISNAKMILNSVLQNFPQVAIDPKGCPELIKDLLFVQTHRSVNGTVGIKKKGKKGGLDYSKMGHLLDCFRYHLQTYLFDWVMSKSAR